MNNLILGINMRYRYYDNLYSENLGFLGVGVGWKISNKLVINTEIYYNKIEYEFHWANSSVAPESLEKTSLKMFNTSIFLKSIVYNRSKILNLSLNTGLKFDFLKTNRSFYLYKTKKTEYYNEKLSLNSYHLFLAIGNDFYLSEKIFLRIFPYLSFGDHYYKFSERSSSGKRKFYSFRVSTGIDIGINYRL